MVIITHVTKYINKLFEQYNYNVCGYVFFLYHLYLDTKGCGSLEHGVGYLHIQMLPHCPSVRKDQTTRKSDEHKTIDDVKSTNENRK